MGQSKDGGYMKQQTLLPEQLQSLLQQLMSGGSNAQAASEGYKQFLPGGGGGDAIKAQAQRDFQQQTIPSILNAFGPGSKGSTSLNQALATGGADLNTNLAAMLSQAQLQAAHGLGSLGQSQQQGAISTPGFAYMQRQPPLWQQLLQSTLGAGGQAAGAYLGR
jgi:hypothetical protein